MNTIEEYVNKMFKNVVKTEETEQLKVDILANMEDRYTALIEEGASDNEAIGTVIVEFGNIDEVLNEMGLNHEGAPEEELGDVMVVEVDDAHEYIEARRRAGLGIGMGVLSCCFALCGLLVMMAIFSFETAGIFMGLIWMFSFAVIGVAFFVIQGYKLDRYKKYNEPFVLVPEARRSIEEQMENYKKSFIISIVLGIAFCVFALMPVLYGAFLYDDKLTVFGSGLMFLIAGIGVLLFIYSGMIWTGYQNLCDHGKTVEQVRVAQEKNRKKTKINHIIDNIYWPIILVIYFLWSFNYGTWAYSWIIFIIGSVFESMIKSIFGIEED
ncbi:permease prefix domain 1-containing protein [Marinilactibacillus kalidii]|uniref:permease prefix domain 1-containing protein n=1 Tax=Marinilactibacillus kalidii TaxID=2820274 RepID=UPI001ABE1D89|nr:permease prefix domain 1-containing protein [Marinilactibacillus kalidii]